MYINKVMPGYREQVWCNAGHADRSLCNRLSDRQPGPAVPERHTTLSAVSLAGRGESLAAPAQVGDIDVLEM